MKRMGSVTVVAVLLALSRFCAGQTEAQPTSQQAKTDTFLLVEVKGTIGGQFSAAKMKAVLSKATNAQTPVVVLYLDTPGGSVPQAEEIVDLIIEHKDLRFVALVRKALSAGVPITLACREIYFTESATMGAAVSYLSKPSGRPVDLPPDLAEKYQSAWRAVCRKAAENGGHSSLLAEGMVDRDFAITMRIIKDQVILERDGKGELLKASGRILTLTAKEALACGLAKGVVPDIEGLGAKLGMRQRAVANGITAEEPTQFYDLISEKIKSLGLVGGTSLTEIGRKAADKEWASWLKSHLSKVSGTRVSWALILVEAKPPKGVTFEVYATPATKRRPPVLVRANIRRAHKDAVALLPSGSTIILTGRLTDCYVEEKVSDWSGYYYKKWGGKERSASVWAEGRVLIQLDDCVVGDAERMQPVATPTASTTSPVDPEIEAKQRLSIADMYARNGMAAQALKTLRSIIEDFPKTAAAKKAVEQYKQLEDDAKKARKRG